MPRAKANSTSKRCNMKRIKPGGQKLSEQRRWTFADPRNRARPWCECWPPRAAPPAARQGSATSSRRPSSSTATGRASKSASADFESPAEPEFCRCHSPRCRRWPSRRSELPVDETDAFSQTCLLSVILFKFFLLTLVPSNDYENQM